MAYGIRKPGFSYEGYQGTVPAYRAPQRKFRRPEYQEIEEPSPLPGMGISLGNVVLSAAEKRKERAVAAELAEQKVLEKQIVEEAAKKAAVEKTATTSTTGAAGGAGVTAAEGATTATTAAGVEGASVASGGVTALGAASAGMSGIGAGMLAKGITAELGANEELSQGAGLLAAVGTGAYMGAGAGPYGAVVGGVAGGVGYVVAESTWLCTATKESVGLKPADTAALDKLREYAKNMRKKEFAFYLRQGQELVKKVEESESDLKEYYETFKKEVVEPVAKLIFAKQPEAAFNLYAAKTKELFRQYMPELEIKYA